MRGFALERDEDVLGMDGKAQELGLLARFAYASFLPSDASLWVVLVDLRHAATSTVFVAMDDGMGVTVDPFHIEDLDRTAEQLREATLIPGDARCFGSNDRDKILFSAYFYYGEEKKNTSCRHTDDLSTAYRQIHKGLLSNE